MSARCWPWVPVLLLVLCVAGQVLLFVAARGQSGLAVQPAYYERALRWDDRPGAGR